MTCPRLVVPLVLLALLVSGCGLLSGGEATCSEQLPDVRPGVCLTGPDDRRDAPDVRFPVLGDPDRELGVPDHVGQVLVVNFWASWCGPCRREQPELNEAHEQLSRLDVAFLGVDLQESSPANGLAHEREFSIPYPSLWDPTSRYAAQYRGIGAQTVPSTVLIDRQGRVAVTLIGETNAAEVMALARLLVDEPA